MQRQKARDVVIMETVSVCRPDNDLHIIHEEKINIGEQRGHKAIFRARLQTMEESNGNGRYYSRNVINEIVNGLTPKVKNRSLLQEIDHPFVASNGSDDSFKKRAVIVELKNCGSIIRDIYIEGKDVIAEIETLSGFKGPDLRNILVEDKVPIGFSLRMFGRVKPMDNNPSIMEVTTPLKAITYDVVTNPSHSSARVMSFLTESTNYNSFIQEDEEYVAESMDDLLFENEICLPGTCKDACNSHLMSLFTESFNNVRNLRFNI
jgi:hypothetical protein